MVALNNTAYLDGTGYVDTNGNWQLASAATPIPVYVESGAGALNSITEIDYNGGTNPTYVGTAPSGTALSAAKWTIKYLTYDGNNNVLSVLYANTGSATNVWNNRTSYSYS